MIGRVYRRSPVGPRLRMEGVIGAAGFASGDRVVVGLWTRSPVGPLADVMWASPTGVRTLHVGSSAGADFITSVYEFDDVVVDPGLAVEGDGRSLAVSLPAVDAVVTMIAGPGWHIPPPRRPAWVTRWVERPLARALMGVETYGVSPRGVEEWYQATAWRPVVTARATVAGRDLGGLAAIDPPARFGFSEPPRTPSITEVRPLLGFPPRSVNPHAHPRPTRIDRSVRGRGGRSRRAPSAPAG
ncbi:hypothetical protein HC251_08760 [Iamia sp. SCSIO 61187]|uniref:hypothetical protein n=1 Tax=Iamia sp. SCSIO 61187 TaxID=2722752 RepID=UPI001C62FC30|nr:hypothetical protein [Iamia sp. SCSIO 61187]QYG92523.1 hypothetical protein HC251_08760 [Iamia sp. SCSIO 61187]